MEEYREGMRIRRTGLVDGRGAREGRYARWTFGELAYITFYRDDAARSCAALSFHALPVHVRKGSPKWPFRLRHPPKMEMLGGSLLKHFMLKMAISPETSSKKLGF